jgi:hypothetical protein
MKPSIARLVPIVVLCLAGFEAFAPSRAQALPIGPPPNQCPGDCSPCLGNNDPFCPTGTPTPSTTCWACHWIDEGNGITLKACEKADDREAGHTGCKEDLPLMASCTFSGSNCTGSSTTP